MGGAPEEVPGLGLSPGVSAPPEGGFGVVGEGGLGLEEGGFPPLGGGDGGFPPLGGVDGGYDPLGDGGFD